MFDGLFKNTLAPLMLRLALAAIFIYHGFDKVIYHNWGTEWMQDLRSQNVLPPDSVMEKLENKSTKEAVRHEWAKTSQDEAAMPEGWDFAAIQIAVAWGELFGGVALAFGFLTRLAALGLLIIQAGAIYTVTLQRGFSPQEGGGYEYNLALVAMCVSLFCWGAGNLSVDNLFRGKRKL
jgi:uncharacterized membrane protein YphA (DoxX/SURF4 family)